MEQFQLSKVKGRKMEKFKIDNFLKENNKKFPNCSEIEKNEKEKIQKQIRKIFDEDNYIEVNKKLYFNSEYLGTLSEEGMNSYYIKEILKEWEIEFAEKIYINWDDFSTIDVMRFEDFINYIDDIWYPMADDINIFYLSSMIMKLNYLK